MVLRCVAISCRAEGTARPRSTRRWRRRRPGRRPPTPTPISAPRERPRLRVPDAEVDSSDAGSKSRDVLREGPREFWVPRRQSARAARSCRRRDADCRHRAPVQELVFEKSVVDGAPSTTIFDVDDLRGRSGCTTRHNSLKRPARGGRGQVGRPWARRLSCTSVFVEIHESRRSWPHAEAGGRLKERQLQSLYRAPCRPARVDVQRMLLDGTADAT